MCLPDAMRMIDVNTYTQIYIYLNKPKTVDNFKKNIHSEGTVKLDLIDIYFQGLSRNGEHLDFLFQYLMIDS